MTMTFSEKISCLKDNVRRNWIFKKLIFTKELFNKTRNKYQETIYRVNFGQSIQWKSMVTKTGYKYFSKISSFVFCRGKSYGFRTK